MRDARGSSTSAAAATSSAVARGLRLGWRPVGVDSCAPGDDRGGRASTASRARVARRGRVEESSGSWTYEFDAVTAVRPDRVPARTTKGSFAEAARPLGRARTLRLLVPQPALQPGERERVHGGTSSAAMLGVSSRSCVGQLARSTPVELHELRGVARSRRRRARGAR